jgi:hypothetical protein
MKISDRPESKFYNIGWTTVKDVPSLCRHNPHLEMMVMNYPTLDASQKQQATEMIMAAIRDRMDMDNVAFDSEGRFQLIFFI